MGEEVSKRIEFLRVFAFLLVFSVHFFQFLSPDTNLKNAFGNGQIGVDIFFVLSGFVIAYSLSSKCDKFFFLTFLRKRFLRIFPLYWICSVVLYVVYLVGPQYFNSIDRLSYFDLVISLALFPFLLMPSSQGDPILSIGWTLYLEVYFYFIAGVLFKIFGKCWWKYYFVFSLFVFTLSDILPFSLMLFNPFMFEFGVGVLLYSLNIHKIDIDKKYYRYLFVGFFSLLLVSMIPVSMLFPDLLFGKFDFERVIVYGGFALIFVLLIFWMRSPVLNSIIFKLAALGKYTYIAYLGHLFIIGFFYRGLSQFVICQNIPCIVSQYLMLLCITFAVSIAVRKFVEIPFLNYFRA
jgi:exopolysaccharide production protein ExoZ